MDSSKGANKGTVDDGATVDRCDQQQNEEDICEWESP
jgi:hypothetical protein